MDTQTQQIQRTKKIQRHARKARGMTLIEIMIVIAILGVMFGAAAIALIPRLHEARVERVYQDFGTVQGALKLYQAKKGKYPDGASGLKALVDTQLLEKMPQDPWNNDYVYSLESNKPVLKSYGADGQEGGEGSDQDLISNQPKPE